MWPATSTSLALIALLTVATDAGLLRVPKIYNTVITSDANLEPSRAYPIVQPVLTVGVQPVVAAAAIPAVVEDPRVHAAYYPVAVGGLYPFLTGTNALYPAPVLYQPAYGPGPVQLPGASVPVPVPALAPAAAPIPAPAPVSAPASAIAPVAVAQQQPQQQPQHPPMPVSDVLNNHHRLNNPGIPDVPPPPLPVSASKKS